MSFKVLCGVAGGFAIGGIATWITYGHALSWYATAVAVVAGYAIGLHCASRWRIAQALAHVQEMGGGEAFLDQVGRDSMVLWIPLEHSVNDADLRFARKLGEAFNKDSSSKLGIAIFGGLQTGPNKIGVALFGRDADVMLETVRPFFQKHCPRGSYLTRGFILFDDRWPHPVPLFEDEQIRDD